MQKVLNSVTQIFFNGLQVLLVDNFSQYFWGIQKFPKLSLKNNREKVAPAKALIGDCQDRGCAVMNRITTNLLAGCEKVPQ
ncbi:MAG: hypothetical protein PVF82_12605 [Gammaproteobacteria bacterium]|jgi:hypothetical protein